jgi:hypothetical protein
VTTKRGHFNAFPIVPDSRVPDFRLEHWPALMENIRATPGVQFVVLNHPRDVHTGFCPFAETNFNAETGENLRGFEFSFDGVELINSGALRTDVMQVFHDWFALLNYGYKIVGVGGSDSHDVSRFIVGQGRTYIMCDDKDPSRINVAEAMANLRQGKALILPGPDYETPGRRPFWCGRYGHEHWSTNESERRSLGTVVGHSRPHRVVRKRSKDRSERHRAERAATKVQHWLDVAAPENGCPLNRDSHRARCALASLGHSAPVPGLFAEMESTRAWRHKPNLDRRRWRWEVHAAATPNAEPDELRRVVSPPNA